MSHSSRTPYQSWKQYRNSQVRGVANRDSILNHIETEENYFMEQKFNMVCIADRNMKRIEISADTSAEKIEALKKIGYLELVYVVDVVEMDSGNAIAVEPKTVPTTLECGHCGGTLHHVSIEDGYSCENEECILHFNQLAYGEC